MNKVFEYDVFISFASEDEEIVKPLWQSLSLNGLRVFWSSKTLKKEAGKNWSAVIEHALENSQHFLLVCTENSMTSKFVELEYRTFHNQFYIHSDGNRRFIIKLENNFKINSLPAFLKEIQALDSNDELVEILGGKSIERLRQDNRILKEENNILNDENNNLKAENNKLKTQIKRLEKANNSQTIIPPTSVKKDTYNCQVIHKNGTTTTLRGIWINYSGGGIPMKEYKGIKIKNDGVSSFMEWSIIDRLIFINDIVSTKPKLMYNYQVEIVDTNNKKINTYLDQDYSMLKEDTGLLFGFTDTGESKIRFSEIRVIQLEKQKKVDTAVIDINIDSEERLIMEFGIPAQHIELSGGVIFYLYSDKLVKALPNEKNFLVFRKLPRNENNEIDKTLIPSYPNWESPKGIILSVIAVGKLMKGMRIEEVALVAGSPTQMSQHSGAYGGTYWRTNIPDYGSMQFTTGKIDLILETSYT